MKKILLISYHFPPDNAVGGLRIAKFVRYLPSFGWEPTVLTIKDRYREQLDKERVNDLRNIRVLQTIKLPTVTEFLLLLKRFVLSMFRNRKMKENAERWDIYGENFGDPKSENCIAKLKRYFLSFSLLPDGERSWVIPASIKALSEIRRRRIDCIMTSSPPHSSHLIGLIAKKLTGIRWVADFRDPWIDDLWQKPPVIRSRLSDKIERWMELRIIQNADSVVATTEEHKEAIHKRYPEQREEKFLYLPNGIDAEKFLHTNRAKKFNRFTITYAGSIYIDRTPEPLFMAIKKLLDEGKINPHGISVKLVGHCQSIQGKPTLSVVRSHGLKGIVEITEPVPYDNVIEMMCRSHLLLLIATPLQRLNVPAKIYDYFGTGVKILALTDGGATADLIKKTNSGECFAPGDIDLISEYVYTQVKNGGYGSENNPDFYSQFDAKALTQQLAYELSRTYGRS